MNPCIYCGTQIEGGRHAFPSSHCWTPAEAADHAPADGPLGIYMAGHRVGYDAGDRHGYRRGYNDGTQDARLTDDQFLEAVARRVRRLELIQDGVAVTVAGTISAIAAHAYRKAGDRNE